MSDVGGSKKSVSGNNLLCERTIYNIQESVERIHEFFLLLHATDNMYGIIVAATP